mmetsp:Transcript_6416/g.14069  ORF Transcript_6416/g.14069 Transcript_6416/m.14069 type:complete len:161 (-) Transcript_6416:295-777(-)
MSLQPPSTLIEALTLVRPAQRGDASIPLGVGPITPAPSKSDSRVDWRPIAGAVIAIVAALIGLALTVYLYRRLRVKRLPPVSPTSPHAAATRLHSPCDLPTCLDCGSPPKLPTSMYDNLPAVIPPRVPTSPSWCSSELSPLPPSAYFEPGFPFSKRRPSP